MLFRVVPRARMDLGEGEKKLVTWPEVEVEAEDRWGAVAKVAVSMKLTEAFTLSELWKTFSVKKAEKLSIKNWKSTL